MSEDLAQVVRRLDHHDEQIGLHAQLIEELRRADKKLDQDIQHIRKRQEEHFDRQEEQFDRVHKTLDGVVIEALRSVPAKTATSLEIHKLVWKILGVIATAALAAAAIFGAFHGA